MNLHHYFSSFVREPNPEHQTVQNESAEVNQLNIAHGHAILTKGKQLIQGFEGIRTQYFNIQLSSTVQVRGPRFGARTETLIFLASLFFKLSTLLRAICNKKQT